jgi:Fe2+ or Zn2+ uptake regulation protein
MRGIVERLKDKGVTLTPQRMALADGCPMIARENTKGCKVEEVQAYLYAICSECLKSASEKRE